MRKTSPTNQLILCPLLCLLSYSKLALIQSGKKENLKWIFPEVNVVNLLVADVVNRGGVCGIEPRMEPGQGGTGAALGKGGILYCVVARGATVLARSV